MSIIDREKNAKFVPIRNIDALEQNLLDYEPVQVFMKTVAEKASKVADEAIMNACIAAEVDPDALVNCMKKIRKLESEVKRLTPIVSVGQHVYSINSNTNQIDKYVVVAVHHYLSGLSQFTGRRYIGTEKTAYACTWTVNKIGKTVFTDWHDAEEALGEGGE